MSSYLPIAEVVIDKVTIPDSVPSFVFEVIDIEYFVLGDRPLNVYMNINPKD